MSVRIDGQQPPADADAGRRLESARTAGGRRPGPAQARSASGDRVQVSTDAQLVSAAVQAAQNAPGVRPGAVERGRRALASGTLGADADRLAQRIVDALLPKRAPWPPTCKRPS
jgi:flagellar biosynthesis anti-sigma factor FlgM